MIYTDATERAMRLAYEKHQGALDKAGVPYIFHPIHVAEQMDDEDSTIVALLHDILEDTDVTIGDLREIGFSETVIEALDCLTHRCGESYLDYIDRVAENDLATKVKIADIEHNADVTRVRNNPELVQKFQKKYGEALPRLKAKAAERKLRSMNTAVQ